MTADAVRLFAPITGRDGNRTTRRADFRASQSGGRKAAPGLREGTDVLAVTRLGASDFVHRPFNLQTKK